MKNYVGGPDGKVSSQNGYPQMPVAKKISRPRKRSNGPCTTRNLGNLLIWCCFVLIIAVVAVVFIAANQEDVNPEPLPTVSVKQADIERVDGSYIGLVFLTDVGAVERRAFENAAARWNAIVGATLNQFSGSQDIPAGAVLCGEPSLTANETLSFEFLLILASVRVIDGRGNILGQAAPCVGQLGRSDQLLVTLGLMDFDKADLEDMNDDGTLESVILHEMGHVLGIGSLWSSVGQGGLQRRPALLTGRVDQPTSNGNPRFLGDEATNRFDIFLDGIDDDSQSSVPAENGFTNGANNGAGGGSLNVHWDQDALPGELMNFQINPRAKTFPLSAVTIAALQDAGYIVDFNEADAFSARSAREEQKFLRHASNQRVYDLSNDVKQIPFILN